MSGTNESQERWFYLVSKSGMSGITTLNPIEVEKCLKNGWRKVTSDEFDRVLKSASYNTSGQGYEE